MESMLIKPESNIALEYGEYLAYSVSKIFAKIMAQVCFGAHQK